MADSSDFRAWDELIPDALGLIFCNLPLQEILTVVPRVCKSWSRAVSGPYCWQEIDIKDWSLQCKPEQLDQMLQMLITWSSDSFQCLAVFGLQTEFMFSFVADHAGSLQRLELPRSEISDIIVEHIASKLSNITFLDVSYCLRIGPRALEAFGNNCKSLNGLRRKMHPIELAVGCQNEEAYAIAKTMPKLQNLELAYQSLLATEGVLEILSRCKHLEFLDLRGCWEVKIDEKYIKEQHASVKVVGPQIIDCYEPTFLDEYSDYSDCSTYSWEFMEHGLPNSDDDTVWEDSQGLDELEVGFNGSGLTDAVAAFDLPPSP